jgi:hypothetical protein
MQDWGFDTSIPKNRSSNDAPAPEGFSCRQAASSSV